MEVLSLAWRTDLALLERSGSEVEHHPTHVVVRTPSNPTHRWGNFVLLRRTPLARDLDAVLQRVDALLPGSGHRAIGIDDPTGSAADLDLLARAGHVVSADVVLTADDVTPPDQPARSVTVRRLTGEADWQQRLELDLACHGTAAAYADFAARRVAAERRATEAGHGAWFGAFEDGRMLAGVGIMAASPGLARFQNVETRPEARRRGLAGTLVHAAGSHALDAMGAATLVIVADPDYPAIDLYRRLGFRDTERQLSAERLLGSP